MPQANYVLNQTPDIGDVPAALRQLAEVVRRHAQRFQGLEVHLRTPGGVPYTVVPHAQLCETAGLVEDAAGDVAGTLAFVEAEDDRLFPAAA